MMKRGKYYSPPANGPYGYPRGNRAMASKRVSGPTPNMEMITRIRVQEERVGGTFVFNPRTGKRTVLNRVSGAALFADPSAPIVTVRDEHFH
jgi:hypothetical protein